MLLRTLQTVDQREASVGSSGSPARRARPRGLKLGICGEHGATPPVQLHAAGLDYVSCLPYRVPIAVLAAPTRR